MVEIDLISVWWIGIGLISVSRSEFTCFFFAVESDLLIVSGTKWTCFLCRGIELDLVLEWDRNWLDFSDGVQINLSFLWGSNLTGSQCRGRNGFFLCVSFDKGLVLVSGSTLTLLFCDDIRPQI